MTAHQTKTHQMKRRSQGFTLIEILVVIGVIAAMAAVTLPNIAGYLRSARIRSAQDQVFSAIQRARAKAITNNSQYGVVFVIESPQIFWVHIEDPEPPAAGQALQTGRQPLNSGANPRLSTRYELDAQVRFAVAAGSCPAGPGGGNQNSLRFDRYGVRTFPGFVPAAPEAAVPALQAAVGPTVTGIMMTNTSAEASICLVDQQTGLSRLITIAAGGRVKKG
ncbi:MAG: prepilin-type N-terminal cleavage/methylation domain-containing protein [Vicinamibacteria bacterium]|nr:prepilin-type N-terminal cleavage/methylation domain-containing protein [Vicinamibacteria bacterium]